MIPKNTAPRQQTEKTLTAAERIGRNGAYSGTPGHRYVADYLAPDCDGAFDAYWVVEAINEGHLIPCERCHFLSLPAPAYPFCTQLSRTCPEPVDSCDVCAHLPASLEFQFHVEGMGKYLEDAPALLVAARTDRAETFYDLFMSGCHCADALAWGLMGAALAPLRRADASQDSAGQGTAQDATEDASPTTFDTRRPTLEIAA